MIITIPGIPLPKGRPRATRINGFLSFYTPSKTRAWEKVISTHAALAMGSLKPLEGPLEMAIVFGLPIPQSWPKKRRLDPGEHVSRPDLDNLLKCLLDAFNGIVFKDDAQIVEISVQKCYTDDPRVTVEIEGL